MTFFRTNVWNIDFQTVFGTKISGKTMISGGGRPALYIVNNGLQRMSAGFFMASILGSFLGDFWHHFWLVLELFWRSVDHLCHPGSTFRGFGGSWEGVEISSIFERFSGWGPWSTAQQKVEVIIRFGVPEQLTT